MNRKGFTVWFTGLPCSGKSTLATLLHSQLKALEYRTEILDGDEVRKRLTVASRNITTFLGFLHFFSTLSW